MGRIWAPFILAGPWLVVLGILRITHHPHHPAAWILGVIQSLTGAIIMIGFGVYLSKPAITPRYDWRGRDRSKLERERLKAQQGATRRKHPNEPTKPIK